MFRKRRILSMLKITTFEYVVIGSKCGYPIQKGYTARQDREHSVNNLFQYKKRPEKPQKVMLLFGKFFLQDTNSLLFICKLKKKAICKILKW